MREFPKLSLIVLSRKDRMGNETRSVAACAVVELIIISLGGFMSLDEGIC